jgi:hypothetical protein
VTSFSPVWFTKNISYIGTTDLIIIIIIHLFSYEAWPLLGHTTDNHNSGMGTAFSCSLAVVWDVYIGAVQCCHVLPFSHYKSGLNHLPHSVVRYTRQHLWVRFCTEWPDQKRLRSTRILLCHYQSCRGMYCPEDRGNMFLQKKVVYHLQEYTVSQPTTPQLTTTFLNEDMMNGILNLSWILIP